MKLTALFPGTSPSPCQWTHLLYSIHPNSTFYIHVLLSSFHPCNFLSHGLTFQGWRHKPKPSSQRNGQVLHETYFHITVSAVKILIMIMSVSMISAGFYEDDNDHIHLSILTSSSELWLSSCTGVSYKAWPTRRRTMSHSCLITCCRSQFSNPALMFCGIIHHRKPEGH